MSRSIYQNIIDINVAQKNYVTPIIYISISFPMISMLLTRKNHVNSQLNIYINTYSSSNGCKYDGSFLGNSLENVCSHAFDIITPFQLIIVYLTLISPSSRTTI